MKIFFIIFALFFSVKLFSQKIAESRIDEFTKDTITATSWEKLNNVYYSYLRFRKINATYLLNLKIGLAGIKSIDENAKLMLMTTTDSIIILTNLKFQIACTGCGASGLLGSAAPGFDLNFFITKEQLSYLQQYEIKKYRVYANDGYIEKNLLDKAQKNVRKLAELINKRP